MGKTWNFGQLIDELKWVVNFNEGQSDQDYIGPSADTDKHFRHAINEAYVDEVEEAVQMGDPVYFHVTRNLTWTANAATLDVGADIAGSTIVRIEDITNNTPGELLWVDNWVENAHIYWDDRDTLRWVTAGPASDRTLRFTLVGEAQEMTEDMDEPHLIPRRFRHLLVWSAAIILRTVADEEPPRQFLKRQRDLRERFHKAIAMGRPTQTGYPGTTTNHPDTYGVIT